MNSEFAEIIAPNPNLPMRKFIDCRIFFFLPVYDIISFRTMHFQTIFCGCRSCGRVATEV
jgi:hypothetical protein